MSKAIGEILLDFQEVFLYQMQKLHLKYRHIEMYAPKLQIFADQMWIFIKWNVASAVMEKSAKVDRYSYFLLAMW